MSQISRCKSLGRADAGRQAQQQPWPKRWAGGEKQFALISAEAPHVASVLRPLLGTLAPPAGAEPCDYLRQIGDALAPFSADVVAEVGRWFITERHRDLPSVATFMPEVNKIERKHLLQAQRVAAMVRLDLPPPGDAERAKLARFDEAFRRAAGADVAAAYFDHIAIVPSARPHIMRVIVPTRAEVKGQEPSHISNLRQAAVAALGLPNAEVMLTDAEAYGHERQGARHAEAV